MNFRMDGPTLERTVVSLHRIGPMRGQAPPTLDDMIRDSLFLRIPGGCRTRSGISMYPTPSLFYLPDVAIATLLLKRESIDINKFPTLHRRLKPPCCGANPSRRICIFVK